MTTLLTAEKIFAFIFNELDESENTRVENLIVENEDYSDQISELLDYCYTHKIYTSQQLNLHLDFLRHQFFHQLIKKDIALPDVLKEKYQDLPIEKRTPPLPSSKPKVISKPRQRKWFFWLLGLSFLGFIFVIGKNLISSNNNTPTNKTNKGNASKEIIPKTKNADTFEKTIPIVKDTIPPSSQRKNSTSTKRKKKKKEKTLPKKEPIASVITLDEFYTQWDKYAKETLSKESATRGQEEKDDQKIQTLLEKIASKETLDNSEYLLLGKYYFEKNNYELAIDFFKKINNAFEPTSDWLLMQAYIFQRNKAALKKAKLLFQEKIIKDHRRRIQTYVTKMPSDLKEFLSH